MAKSKRPARSGVLRVDKPSGMTSHDVVSAVRRRFGQREVGHTGTLDPMATGLMLVTLGRAGRIARFLEVTEKTYEGTVRLGRATTTLDAEGETVEEAPVPPLTNEQVEAALASLTGVIEQEVPAFSAVKVDGERLYAKARRGEVVEAPRRMITVHSLSLRAWTTPDISLKARVSKGTYIRTLAAQIGAALGVPAHLSGLRRTAVGTHRVEDAHTLDALEGADGELVPMADALPHVPAVHVSGAALDDVLHGRPLSWAAMKACRFEPVTAGEVLRVLAPDGRLVAVAVAEIDLAEGGSGPTRALRYACVLDTPGAQP